MLKHSVIKNTGTTSVTSAVSNVLPTLGRQVLFQIDTGDDGIRTATVIAVNKDGTIQLCVCLTLQDSWGDTHGRCDGIKYSETKEKRTWHWPARV